MLIIKNIRFLQKKLDNLRKINNKISLVPTMGSLHNGHLSLVKKAKGKNKIVVVSIFVNPTQFGANEDFIKYPKNISKDIKLLKGLSVDILFLPHRKEIFAHKTSQFKQTQVANLFKNVFSSPLNI